MCGIFASYNNLTPLQKSDVQQILNTMSHRGPNGQGIYIQGATTLAHQRLSIIDIDGGTQPIWNETKDIAIICNGEIYNYKKLQIDLEKRGHKFQSNSDSEVLLHLFEEIGPKAFNQVNGMFSVVIYLKQNNVFYIARDRFGQKPLFYSTKNKQFACASGPAQLIQLNWIDNAINYQAINWYLQYQYLPEPHSIYKDIKKLPAGSYAVFSDGQLQITNYFTPKLKTTFTGSFKQAVNQTKNLLEISVKRRLVSDVPLGIFLSGGLDSSLIAYMASKLNHKPIDTFSIGFSENKYDERTYAQEVATAIGSRHHFLEVNPNSWDNLIDASKTFEEPFADSSLLPTMLLSKFAKSRVSVALGGDGADELAGGYYRYQVMHYAQICNLLPLKTRLYFANTLKNILPKRKEERTFFGRIQRLLDISATDNKNRYLELISRFKTYQRQKLYKDMMLKHSHNNLKPLTGISKDLPIRQALMQIDLQTYLLNDILVKVDRASMAYGLEVRAPFLDRDLSDFITSLPVHYTASYTRKKVLNAIGKQILPNNITKRPKMGFGVPLARWYRKEWFKPTRTLLNDSNFLNTLFYRKELDNLLNQHKQNITDNSYQLFALSMLALWAQNNNI